MNYFPNQIIRTLPARDGSFKIFRVIGHVLDMIEVREVNPKTGGELLQETEFFYPSQVQLYTLHLHANTTISIDDVVTARGLKGKHKIRGFFESQGRLLAILTDKDNLARPLRVDFVKKANK